MVKKAKLEDELSIQTKFIDIKKASFELEQNVYMDDKVIFKSKVLMVNINLSGKPIKIPDSLSSVINV
mgnify:CR=1 FL=1